jgi:hypothetical protein
MGWNIPMENFAPAHDDEDQPDLEAPINQEKEILAAPPTDIFSDGKMIR